MTTGEVLCGSRAVAVRAAAASLAEPAPEGEMLDNWHLVFRGPLRRTSVSLTTLLEPGDDRRTIAILSVCAQDVPDPKPVVLAVTELPTLSRAHARAASAAVAWQVCAGTLPVWPAGVADGPQLWEKVGPSAVFTLWVMMLLQGASLFRSSWRRGGGGQSA